MSVNMKFACLRQGGCLILSLVATKACFSVNYECMTLSTAAKNQVPKRSVRFNEQSELCLKLYSVKGVTGPGYQLLFMIWRSLTTH